MRSNPGDKRFVESIKEGYELIDMAKYIGQVYSIQGMAVDIESEELALVYKNGDAEVIPFDEFPDGEFGAFFEAKRLVAIGE